MSIEPTNFQPNFKSYHGPADGRSRPAKKLLRKVSEGVLGMAYSVEIRGADRLPKSGRHVFAANHPGYLDPLVMAKAAGETDLRFMAAIENFANPLSAKMNEWAGAFPVNRKNPHPATLQHGAELFSEGASLGIFPSGQGQEPDTIGTLDAFKPGAALFAVRGKADTIVGMAIHYEEVVTRSKSDKLKSLGKSAVIGAAGAAATAMGGPLGLVALASTGLFAGSAVGATVGDRAMPNPNPRVPFRKLIGRALGATAGAVAGTALAMTAVASLPAVAAVGVVGAAGAGGAYLWDRLTASRERVTVAIAEPIPVPKESGEEKAQVRNLTEQLHRTVGAELSQLSGIPYDVNAPKMR